MNIGDLIRRFVPPLRPLALLPRETMMPFQQIPPDVVLVGFDLAMVTQPYFGETVNGDALFIELGRTDGGLMLLLVDVTHHGPSTMPTLAALQTSLSDSYYHNRQPADLLQWLHDALAPQFDITGNFVAATAICFAPQSQEIIAANAGQPDPLFGQAGAGWQTWKLPAGMLLGIIQGGVPYHEDRLALSTGECLLVFTDGVTEAGAKSNVSQFQQNELMLFLASLPPNAAPAEITRRMFITLRNHVGPRWPDDDTTVFCLRRG